MYVAQIIGVSESELDAILSEKFPPNRKRGTSGVYQYMHLLIMHNNGLDEKQCVITNMHFHVPS